MFGDSLSRKTAADRFASLILFAQLKEAGSTIVRVMCFLIIINSCGLCLELVIFPKKKTRHHEFRPANVFVVTPVVAICDWVWLEIW